MRCVRRTLGEEGLEGLFDEAGTHADCSSKRPPTPIKPVEHCVPTRRVFIDAPLPFWRVVSASQSRKLMERSRSTTNPALIRSMHSPTPNTSSKLFNTFAADPAPARTRRLCGELRPVLLDQGTLRNAGPGQPCTYEHLRM